MKVIYKYELKIDTQQEIYLPKGYNILSVQTQRCVPCLWVEIDKSKEKVPVKIVTIGTGIEFENNGNLSYIGTYQINAVGLVFHVYEEKTKTKNDE